MRRILILPVPLWLVLGAAGPAWARQGADCGACHGQTQKIQGTPHAALGCESCHPQHEKFPHPGRIPKPQCGECHADQAREDARGVHGMARAKGKQGAPDCGVCHGDIHQVQPPGALAFRQSVPETCGMCHTEVVEQFKQSVHGQALTSGNRNAPLCTDCHGEHSIQKHTSPVSPVSAGHIRETCARCHGDVRLSRKFGFPSDRILSFDASYHGLAAKAGSQSAANCASCHGYHNILASSDARSTINPKNLPKTCGHCHPGAGQRFALGPIHLVEGRKESAGVKWARDIYLVLIPLTVGLMLLHNMADFFRKLYKLRLRPAAVPGGADPHAERGAGAPELRMHRSERIQHSLLLGSFTTLVWTGFALKYPDHWWARPLLAWESSWPVRATVHRIAGAVMAGVAIAHLISLFINGKLREHWLELVPRAQDAIEGGANLAWLLGFRARKPRLSAHGYVEKAEYWAVVWGTAVMVATGGLLWAVDYTLRWLPKSWLDFATTVHFYEAVLATLSIVVWHLYFVVFDPDVYPMDTAWLKGYGVRKRLHHGPPKESGESA